MRAVYNKKILRNLILLVLLIIVILLIAMLVLFFKIYSNQDVALLRYMNSDKVNEEYLMIPRNINMVYSYYSGEVSLLTIEKSIYYFSKDVVPKYRNLFLTDNKELEEYFNQNKYLIGVETGIDSIEEFKDFVKGINELKSNLEITTYELSNQQPKMTSNNMITRLLIKYKNNKRIIFKIKVSKDILKNISSIKYLFEKIED